jgi:hypothetical protein
MEKLHIVTLVLEMIGFGLAYIHVFRRSIADRANQLAIDIPSMLFIGIALEGSDSDKSVLLKTRDARAVNNTIYRLFQFVAIIVLFRLFNFGQGFIWGAAEFVSAMIISFPAALLAFIVLAMAVNGVIWLAVRAGNGHTIIGTGFFIAGCGMAIETYQVWESPYRLTALLLWGVAILLVVGTVVGRRNQGPGQSSGAESEAPGLGLSDKARPGAGNFSQERRHTLKRSRWYGLLAWTIGIAGVLAVLMPAAVYWHKLGSHELSSDPSMWASLGEYFGGVTAPVVSLFALLGLAVNLYLQAVELEKTRDALNRQNFEGTFFELLKQFSEVAENVTAFDIGNNVVRGRAAFARIFKWLKQRYARKMVLRNQPSEAQLTEAGYFDTYKEFEPELGPYFRTLYHVFKFIDTAPSLSAIEKIAYANIARARISVSEALMIFYNGTWGEGRGFRKLIDEYGVLKHLPRDVLLEPSHMDNRDWYSVSAFQSAEDRENKSPYPTAVNSRPPYEEWDEGPNGSEVDPTTEG